MEGEGILKAWRMKLVPKSARITVTKRDSAYSRNVLLAAGRSVSSRVTRAASDIPVSTLRLRLRKLLKRQPRRRQLRLLLAGTFRGGQRAAIHRDFDAKLFAMLRPA